MVNFSLHRAALALLSLAALTACGPEPELVEAVPSGAASTLAPVESGPRVLFLGDSLSAGLHLPAEQAFPALLAERLGRGGLPVQLVNAGVSGDTTAGGLARLDWLLRQEPDLVVVELGGNDGLRGVRTDAVEENLRAIVQRSQAAGAEVLLLGMKLPPNYGAAYTSEFEAVFARVAAEQQVEFIPFFLEGVGGVPAMTMEDGLHPTAAGHRRLADNLYPVLSELVRELARERGGEL
jgi:acyl-CoA thioesterase-1